MLWRLFQIAVFIGVAGWLAQEKLTPNGFLISLCAIGAAFAATLLLSKIFDGFRWLAGRKQAAIDRRERAVRESLRQRPLRGARPQ